MDRDTIINIILAWIFLALLLNSCQNIKTNNIDDKQRIIEQFEILYNIPKYEIWKINPIRVDFFICLYYNINVGGGIMVRTECLITNGYPDTDSILDLIGKVGTLFKRLMRLWFIHTHYKVIILHSLQDMNTRVKKWKKNINGKTLEE